MPPKNMSGSNARGSEGQTGRQQSRARRSTYSRGASPRTPHGSRSPRQRRTEERQADVRRREKTSCAGQSRRYARAMARRTSCQGSPSPSCTPAPYSRGIFLRAHADMSRCSAAALPLDQLAELAALTDGADPRVQTLPTHLLVHVTLLRGRAHAHTPSSQRPDVAARCRSRWNGAGNPAAQEHTGGRRSTKQLRTLIKP